MSVQSRITLTTTTMIGRHCACTISVISTASVGILSSISQRGTYAFTMTPTCSSELFPGRFMRAAIHEGRSRPSPCAFSSSSVDRALRASADGNSSPFSELHGKNLVSIRQCIDAQEKQQRQQAGQRPKIVFVDGSWYHKPDSTTGLRRDPSLEYIAGPRLPNARYLDIDAVATTYELFPDRNPKALPHMMPPPKLFGLAMDAYNIRNEDHVIIYARRGALFTPRVWFLFVSMGHDPQKVHLMQGSLEDYMDEGGPIDSGNFQLGDKNFAATIDDYTACFDQGILNVNQLFRDYYSTTSPEYNATNAMNVCGKEEVLDAVNLNLERDDKDGSREMKSVIIDTRGSGYAKKGHMPSAIHLPYTQIASANNSLVFKPNESLKKLFGERGIDCLDPELKVIFSCGSGV
ncbi:hypothetical protein ACHAWF_017647 [Thalassiosira exigua]